MAGVVLKGLRPRDYEHPFDRRALAALESNATLSAVVAKLNQYGIERTLWLNYAASNVRATGGRYLDAVATLAEAARRLDAVKPPDLYVDWDRLHATVVTVGTERPLTVLSSLLLDSLSGDELLFVFGHELGHLRSRHIVYSQLATVLPVVGDVLKTATLGIGGLLSSGLQLSVSNWLRMSDFSADRAGLLACQDLEVALRVLLKLGGAVQVAHPDLDVEDFRVQARSFGGYDFDAVDKLTRVVSATRAERPWTVMRASELIEWVESGKYDSLLTSTTAGSGAEAAATPPADPVDPPPPGGVR